MKKILAVMTVLVVSAVASSAWADGCGGNYGRNAPTTGQPSRGPQPVPGTPHPAGIPR